MIIILTFIIAVISFFFWVFSVNQKVHLIVLILRIITNFYDLITFPIYYIIEKPWKYKKFSQTNYADRHYEPNGNYTYWEIKPEILISEQKKNCEIEEMMNNVMHLSELLPIAQKLYADKISFGRRDILFKFTENNKKKFELSEYKWTTYRKTQEMINDLVKIFYHKFHLKGGDRIAIIADTCFEWFVSFFTLQYFGCQVVTLPASIGKSNIVTILNTTRVEYVFIQTDLVRLLTELKSEIKTVKNLIIFKNPFVDQLTEAEKNNTKYNLYDFDKLIEEGQKLPTFDLNKSLGFSTNDIAVIMFTSGSTGNPKGVLITHANILQSVKCIMKRVCSLFEINNLDTFLAYLPMSHIFEMLCEITFYMIGVKLAFGRASTLMTGVALLANGCSGDVQASAPTFLVGVPLIFERLQGNIQNLLKSKSLYAAGIYDWAYNYKKKWSKRGFKCKLIDTFFFKFIKNQFGGRLRVIVVGGAPLMLETQIFIKMYLNVKLALGYSSTECTGNGCLTILDEFDHANICALMEGVKLRLEDWPEGGYSLNDKPNSRGEIILGTKATSIGYFENEEETSKAFFKENNINWWRSGDIGEVDQYGYVRIIDRKKDLVKLQIGEYIALGKCEAVLKNCMYVENMVLHGNSYHNHLIGLLQPNKENLMKLAASINNDTNDFAELCDNPNINKIVLDELIKFGKSNGLTSKEVPYLIKLCPEPWTANSGLLTASLKTKRTQIYAFYKKSIDLLYKELDSKFSS